MNTKGDPRIGTDINMLLSEVTTLTLILGNNSRKVSNQYSNGKYFIVTLVSKYKMMRLSSYCMRFDSGHHENETNYEYVYVLSKVCFL